MPLLRIAASLTTLLMIAALAGCEKQPSTATSSGSSSNSNSHTHADGTVHTDAPEATGDTGHHGKPIELGTATAGEFTLRAARDDSGFVAGGDSPIDVWVTGGTAKVVGVRFWIGTEDAKGSLKAKADIEISTEPNHWHTHAEIPDPIPAGCKLWIEVEDDKGGRSVASFDLKT